MANTEQETVLIELAAGIVESYVSNNQMHPEQVPEFLGQIHAKLEGLQKRETAPVDDRPEPPVKPQNSVRKSDVVCLECGKTYKTLKRHIKTDHGMDEKEYKERWGLPTNLSLVSKDYSARRSQMAKQFGLGNKRRKRK